MNLKMMIKCSLLKFSCINIDVITYQNIPMGNKKAPAFSRGDELISVRIGNNKLAKLYLVK